jgi:Icc-related predicted phosphoesterase/uncharacterized membrane protein YeaQ/YmgE (transglycosylase-associated protein family)
VIKTGFLFKNRWLGTLLQLAVALAGAVLFIWILGPAEYQLDGFKVRGAVRPALSGRTVVEFPPLGTLTAETHSAPLECRVTLVQVEEKMVTATLNNPDLGMLWARLETDVARALKAFVFRQFLLGILGAVVLTWFVFRPPLRKIWQPALAGFLLTAAWLTPAYLTYRADAFRHPAYSGMIEAAPQVLALSQDLVTGFQEFKSKAPAVVANLQALFNRADSLNAAAAGDNGTKLLLVADIQNNPVGLALVQELVSRFDVDAVLDAGDLTDLGSPLELALMEDIKRIPVPYVFAPGNHDSPEVMEFVAAQPRAHVLEGRTITVAGLTVLGSPHPSAYRAAPKTDTPEQEEAELRTQADALAKALRSAERPVDILMVHDPRVARRFAGRVPLVVCGHTHRPAVEGDGSSLLLNPGTTGAAGIRGLQSAREIPYSAMVVHLDAARRPVALDIIAYGPREGNFRVEHRLISNE